MYDHKVLDDVVQQMGLLRQWLLASLGSDKYPMRLSHTRVLIALNMHGPQTIGELAGRLQISHSACSELVSGLERIGWVERKPSPSDRRCVIVEHTAKARAAGDEVRKRRRVVMEDVLARLLPDEQGAFLKGMLELSKVIGFLPPEQMAIATGPARIRSNGVAARRRNGADAHGTRLTVPLSRHGTFRQSAKPTLE